MQTLSLSRPTFRFLHVAVAGLALSALLVGCAAPDTASDAEAPAEAAAPDMADKAAMAEEAADTSPDVAIARLMPREGSEVTGLVTFTPGAEGGVKVLAEVEGLTGSGERGFHVHEIGDCSAADFTSAGGHFNPTGAEHGAPGIESHAGDLGNLEIVDGGVSRLTRESMLLSLDPADEGFVVGRAVILHEGTDDLETQPTGAAGGRVACGLVTWAETAAGFDRAASDDRATEDAATDDGAAAEASEG